MPLSYLSWVSFLPGFSAFLTRNWPLEWLGAAAGSKRRSVSQVSCGTSCSFRPSVGPEGVIRLRPLRGIGLPAGNDGLRAGAVLLSGSKTCPLESGHGRLERPLHTSQPMSMSSIDTRCGDCAALHFYVAHPCMRTTFPPWPKKCRRSAHGHQGKYSPGA